MEHVEMTLVYSLSFAWISTPNSTNVRTTLSWPYRLAWCKLVHPLKFIMIMKSWKTKKWHRDTHRLAGECQHPIQSLIGPHSRDHFEWHDVNSSVPSSNSIWLWVHGTTHHLSREYQHRIQLMFGQHSHDHSDLHYVNSYIRSNALW